MLEQPPKDVTGTEARVVAVRPALNGSTSHPPEVVLRENSKTRISVHADFVGAPDSAPRRLSLVLTKGPATGRTGPPAVRIRLEHDEVLGLRDTLSLWLQLAGQSVDRQWLCRPYEPGRGADFVRAFEAASAISPEQAGKLVELVGDNERAVLATRLRLRELRQAVSQLESYLGLHGPDAAEDGEEPYQQWCAQHNWAFGNAYVRRDAKRSVSIRSQVDGLLQGWDGLRDLYELKRPGMPVLQHTSPTDWERGHWHFSSDVTKAIGQCHRYLEDLHEASLRPGTRDLLAHYPRAVLVIGRSTGWDETPAGEHYALRGLNSRLHGVAVITYDHLLAQARQALALMDQGVDPQAQSSTH